MVGWVSGVGSGLVSEGGRVGGKKGSVATCCAMFGWMLTGGLWCKSGESVESGEFGAADGDDGDDE
jgi:hypothetical protein